VPAMQHPLLADRKESLNREYAPLFGREMGHKTSHGFGDSAPARNERNSAPLGAWERN
jgi:hypothetical protein